MKYFRVEEEYVSGTPQRIEVADDGDPIGEPYDVVSDSIDYTRCFTLGYNVFEEDEQGMTQNVEFYPVATNFSTFESNMLEVLEQIKQDHPASEWQNNNW